MPPSKRAKQLGRLIKKYRQAKGLSQRTAAERMGYHHSYLARLETGDYESPKPQQLKTIARALDIPTEDLYALAGYQVEDRLPDFAPYLRAKFDLPDEAVDRLEEYFQMIRDRYDPTNRGGETDG
jgi:transcriptional regulator with XRE-family HTH domain